MTKQCSVIFTLRLKCCTLLWVFYQFMFEMCKLCCWLSQLPNLCMLHCWLGSSCYVITPKTTVSVWLHIEHATLNAVFKAGTEREGFTWCLTWMSVRRTWTPAVCTDLKHSFTLCSSYSWERWAVRRGRVFLTQLENRSTSEMFWQRAWNVTQMSSYMWMEQWSITVSPRASASSWETQRWGESRLSCTSSTVN